MTAMFGKACQCKEHYDCKILNENGHVTEVTFVEIEGSCYRGGLFNGRIMVMF